MVGIDEPVQEHGHLLGLGLGRGGEEEEGCEEEGDFFHWGILGLGALRRDLKNGKMGCFRATASRFDPGRGRQNSFTGLVLFSRRCCRK
jgi:hypothetical protein